MAEKGVSKVENNEEKFAKEQILAARRFTGNRDLLGALLENGKSYTIAEVIKRIEAFRKGKVD